MVKKILLFILLFLIPIILNNEGINILNTNNTLLNFTRFNKIEEPIFKALFHLNMEGLVISIHEVPKEFLYIEGNLTVNGFVIKDEENECSYYLFISPLLLSKGDLNEVLSHELIHINQYYKKKLISTSTEVCWEGNSIDINKLNYLQRPWEIEAFENQTKLSNKIS